MKCRECNAVNKKDDERCKKCNALLHVIEENKEEQVVIEEKKEGQVVIEEKKEEIKQEKRKNPFKKILLTIRIIIILLVLAIVGLVVYIYTIFDYNKYFEDNVNRYYETENKQYLDNIKLLFKVYRLNDSKISKMQEKGLDITSIWIDEIKNNDYTLEEEYLKEVEYTERVIDTLYQETEYEGHTAISKKAYNSLTFSLKELEQSIEESEEQEEVVEYDISNFKVLDIDGALDLFTKKDVSILYLGRETCHFCVQYVPILNSVQKKYNYKTYYLDITTVDMTTDAYNKFIAKLDLEYDMDGEKDTYGAFYGYTPMTIVIQDGKMVDGLIGYVEEEVLTELVSKYVKD